MKEVFYNYQEFKEKVNPARQIHHQAIIKPADKQGIFQNLIFRLYGIDKNSSHILIFEKRKLLNLTTPDQTQKTYQKLVEKYAKPLGSTEGAWKQ